MSLLSRTLGRTELRKTESIRTRSSIAPKVNTVPVTIIKNEDVTSAHINFLSERALHDPNYRVSMLDT